MGSGGDEDDLEQIARIFRDDVLKPMMSTGASPDEIKKLVKKLQVKLDALKVIIDADDAPAVETQPATQRDASEVTPAITSPEMILGDELGRNQRTRLRELVLLTVLEKEKKAYPLQQLLSDVNRQGFDATRSAIISQLNRMIADDYLETPSKGSGMYTITKDGLVHLQELRTNFAHLLR